MRNLGTPKNLKQAVINALCFGPLNEIPEKAPYVIKDYLAQKFGAAYIKARTEEESKLLKELWEEITKDLED